MSTQSLFLISILFSAISNPFFCRAQTKTDSLFFVFREDIQIEYQQYGRIIMDDDTRASYHHLLKDSSVETLATHCNDSIAAIRCLAYAGLVNKQADKVLLERILKEHVNDTSAFVSGGADAIITWRVFDYMKTALEFHKKKDPGPSETIPYKERKQNLRIVIPGARHSVLSQESLSELDSLSCSIESFQIVSFLLVTEHISLNAVGNILTKEMKTALSKLKPGDRFWFDGIKCSIPDKTIRHLGSLGLRVK